MYRMILRLITACALILALCIAASADLLPVPRYPSSDQIINGNFDGGNADYWTLKSTDGKDKVKCKGIGYNSDCAFRFKGSDPQEATKLKQVFLPPENRADEPLAVVIFGEAYVRPIKGTSCLKMTVKVKFLDPEAEVLKGSYEECGDGTPEDEIWHSTHEVGESSSFDDGSYKKVIVSFKHTGIGQFLVDDVTLEFEEK